MSIDERRLKSLKTENFCIRSVPVQLTAHPCLVLEKTFYEKQLLSVKFCVKMFHSGGHH